jgi:hypothetical protein
VSTQALHRMAKTAQGYLPSHRLWSNRETALLGTMPDADLAKVLGRSVSAVRGRRERSRLPAFREKLPAHPAESPTNSGSK